MISPLLMNVALHGLEEAAGVRYRQSASTAGTAQPGTPILVRYADDLVVCCHSQRQAQQVKTKLSAWLTPRGLTFNEDKTKIVHLAEGFDFLGFNVRRYRNGKLIIRPSQTAVRRIRKRLAAEVRSLRGSNASAVIARLTPVVRGWAAYYRGVVSSRIFSALDHYVWRLTYKWGRHMHPTNRRSGSSVATSASSTSTGTTCGCSATAETSTTAGTSLTWSSSPGRASSDTSWSQARRHLTTPT